MERASRRVPETSLLIDSLETPVHVRSDPRLPGEDSTAHLTIPGSLAPPTRPALTLPSPTERVYGACNPCQA